MRYVLIFVLVASIVMAFLFADQFPGLLADYPGLQEANRTVRSWLGLANSSSSHLSERKMRETEQIFRQESRPKKEVTEEDLGEYYE